MSDEVKATLKQIAEFFSYDSLAQFRKDWMTLSEQDKSDLQVGLGNGTLTY